MKKVITSIVLLLCIGTMIFIFYKTKGEDISSKLTFDKTEDYKGFSDLPKNYTIEEAEDDGYFVTKDLSFVANKDLWDNFVKASSLKKNTSIRMVSFFTEDKKSPYFKDLFYQDGYYYLFDSSAETEKNQEKEPFLHLLTLVQYPKEPLKGLSIIVLTNDNTLTFKKFNEAMYSSNSEVSRSILPYKLVAIKNQ